MLQLEMTRVTVHVRQPDRSWRVYEVDDAQQEYLSTDVIREAYGHLKKMFPNRLIFIQIQNV